MYSILYALRILLSALPESNLLLILNLPVKETRVLAFTFSSARNRHHTVPQVSFLSFLLPQQVRSSRENLRVIGVKI